MLCFITVPNSSNCFPISVCGAITQLSKTTSLQFAVLTSCNPTNALPYLTPDYLSDIGRKFLWLLQFYL